MKAAAVALLLSAVPLPVAAEPLRPLSLRQDMLGWEGVGRLTLGRKGYCTGVLITADTVLTAAHCLFDGSAARAREEITFRAGDRNGEAIAERRVTQAAVPPGYHPGHPDPATRIATDVAILRLDAPVPAGTARPFLVDPAMSRGEVSVVSYGTGRDSVLSRQARCNVLGRQGAIVAIDCDVTFGSSGAPVFRISGSQMRIVSIVAAGRNEEGQSLAFGPVLVDRVAELQAMLRTGKGLWEEEVPTSRRLAPGSDRSAGGARFLRP